MGPELSEYEQQRQANIAQRDKLLKQLALDAGQAGLGPQKPKATAKSTLSKKKTPVKKVKVEDAGPRRTSSRLLGLTADSEVAKRKAEDEYVAVQTAAKVKRQRHSGDLNLGDVVVGGRDWNKSQNFLVDVVSRGGDPYERTFGETEVKETSDKELRALREQMSALELYDGFEPNRIKITPERIYSLGFHPTTDKPLIFAGDKMGNLGIFDASQTSNPAKKESGVKKEEDGEEEEDDDPDPAVTSFHCHTRTISSFQFSPINPSHLYTCSYDSSLRLLDLTKSTSTEIYAPADTSADEPLSGVEVDPTNPHMLYFSRLDGHVGRTDTRAPKTTDIFQLSEKKIGGFSMHPGNPHFIATASLDRYLRIWDLRKLSGKVGRQTPALIGEHESRLSVSHAAFNSAGQVATASYDDTVKIHTFEGMGSWKAGHELSDEDMAPSSIIRHNNQTGRWVTILRAQWQRHPPDSIQRFCIGNMNRFVDIYTANGEQLAQLGGDGITAVPAVAQFHPSEQWVAAGTASDKYKLDMTPRTEFRNHTLLVHFNRQNRGNISDISQPITQMPCNPDFKTRAEHSKDCLSALRSHTCLPLSNGTLVQPMKCLPANRQVKPPSPDPNSKNFLDMLRLSHVHGRTRKQDPSAVAALLDSPPMRLQIATTLVREGMQDQGVESKESNRLVDMSSSKAGARLLAKPALRVGGSQGSVRVEWYP